METLKDEQEFARRRAIYALGKIRPVEDEVAEALIQLLADENISEDAETSLCSMGDKVTPFLIRALQSKNPVMRERVTEVLGKIRPVKKGVVQSLILGMQDKISDVRYASICSLGEIGPEAIEAVPALIAELLDTDRYLCVEAITALGKIGPKNSKVVPALVRRLKDKNKIVPI